MIHKLDTARRLTLYALLTLILVACDKQVNDRSREFPALAPAKTDINAGTWKTILITAPDVVSVPAPAAPTGPDYVAQLNEIKSAQANLGKAGKENLRYWSAGAVLRWNEITRQLVAKHNRPPYQNPDGTYPIPDASNPLAYPTFPFANPPYAARAYSYISAACYDALVACYHYKKLYNRAAPYTVNNTIEALVPKSDVPSYPSEDATVAGVMWEMMKLLFPGDQDFVQQQIQNHMDARMASGANVRTDWEAGYALGRAIALQFVTRARADRAGAAVGSMAIQKAMEDDCISRGEIPWYSQEEPKRPGMLMHFGRVRTWNFDSATLIGMRPPPPPSTSSEQFKKEVEEITEYAKNPTREQIRIAQFWSDGIGTYTPPGHWNAIAAEDFVKMNWSEVRWARNMALLNTALMDAAVACWDAKYFYFNPRPYQMDKRNKTTAGLPNFPSYTSGHSTFSGAAATVLAHVVKAKAADYMAMADEASISRQYGAIHYKIDCTEGLKHGYKIGQYAINRAKTDGADE
ncbi:MAG TPA: phosphatase PAP2 family protein [Phnomibacter sp.]|nr:phosphatase PAP2 family protein [Phnomibacter sp.]